MFELWLSMPGWAILLSLTAFFGATGAAMHRLCFAPGGAPRLASFTGVAPPFLALPTFLFGLMAGFLASDVWNHARQASGALLDERDAAVTIASLDQAIPATGARLDELVHAYVQAVLTQELLAGDDRGSPAVQLALERLMREIARPEVATEAGTSVQTALLTAAARLSGARSTRLALSNATADGLKWATVACLALLAEIGVAIVHLERARAQIGALVVFTGCVVSVMTLIAVYERPFIGSHEASAALLQAILPQ